MQRTTRNNLIFLLAVGAVALVRRLPGFAARGAACILLCGVLFAFANPPLQTPDETDHYLRTYAISQGRFDFDYDRTYPEDVARLVEASIREMDRGIIEAAESMGCSPLQIITKVILPECVPSLLTGFATAFVTILSYGAMSGAIGGGGLGSMALNRGFTRHQNIVLWGAVILLVILVQIFQTVGTRLAVRLDRRISGKGGRKRRRRETAKKINNERRIGGTM